MNTSKIYNAGIYLRLSRDDEDNDKVESNSITNQRNYLLQFLKDNGYNFIHEYVDDGYSGTTFNRPGFQKMLEDVESGEISMIVTKDLSRLARSTMTSYYLDEYFPLHGIRYIAVLDNYDSDVDNSSKELAWVKNGMNENYCRETSKKVRNGLYQAKKSGLFTGWKAPYGYKRDPEDYHKLIVDTNVCDVVKRIFNLAYEGKGTSQIADILTLDNIETPSSYALLSKKKTPSSNVWCARTISEMLTNQTYIGNLTQGRRKKVAYKVKKEIRTKKEDWIIVENTHEAIIDKEIFETVQNLIGKNKKQNSTMPIKLLKGFIYCKECGHALTITRSKDKKRFYCGCSYYRKYSKHKLCSPHTLNYQKLEDAVLNQIKELCKTQIDKEKIENKLRNSNKLNEKKVTIMHEIEKIEKNMQILSDAIDKSYIDMAKGIIDLDRYQSVSNKLTIELKNNEKEKESLKIKLSELNNNERINNIDYMKMINKCLKLKKVDRRLLGSIIDKIFVSENNDIEIKYKIKLI